MTPRAWTTVMWCLAAAMVVLLFTMITPTMSPVFVRPRQRYHLDIWVRIGMAVLMALPIGLARLRPVPVLGLVLAESTVIAMLRQPTWPMLCVTVVLIGYIAVIRPRRVVAGAAVLTLFVWSAQWGALSTGSWLYLLAVKPGYAALLIVIAWSVGNSIHQRRRYAEALRKQAANQAVVDERLRIARELHDMVAHSIGIIAIQAGAVNRVIDAQTPEVRDALNAIENTSRETLAGLRHTLGMLRETDPDSTESVRSPGLENVDQLARTAADAGIRVQVNWQGRRRQLPADIDLSAFRIIQESVTNVVRHSGSDDCQVNVEFRDAELTIEVVDDGREHRMTGAGYGIAGMRERVGLLHGHFQAGPRPEGGFRVEARLPV
ncbi:sensor histidine kinase [Streptomyces sp. NPDC018026]|uniref:sensor histidine kinase n=1 Tax=Streptomyces sp. NPDC018026 TaxID=3365031 RepID=UPI0037B50402